MDKKHGRYLWSGKCIPKYGKYNKYGQKLIIDKNKNICNYKEDKRKHDKKYSFLMGKEKISDMM